MNELEELARAWGMPDWQIKKCVQSANRSFKAAYDRRAIHRFAKNGWSMNKGKTLYSEVLMSIGEFLLFKDRYFAENADDHEKIKLLEELKRREPRYKTHD